MSKVINDFWFAECLPCRWEVKVPYAGAAGEEDQAIAAAEEHIAAAHPGVLPAERRARFIGHVQLRGYTGALAPPDQPEPPPPDEQPAEPPA